MIPDPVRGGDYQGGCGPSSLRAAAVYGGGGVDTDTVGRTAAVRRIQGRLRLRQGIPLIQSKQLTRLELCMTFLGPGRE